MRFRLEELLVRLVRAIVRLMPMPMVRRTGHAIGRLAYHLDRFHRRIARENLTQAFPSRTSDQIEAIAQAMFAHFGAVLLELLKFGTLTEEDMIRLVGETAFKTRLPGVCLLPRRMTMPSKGAA